MRIFFAVSAVPSLAHRQAGAVTMVAGQAALAFAEAGHEVVVQPILDSSRPGGVVSEERADLEALVRAGLAVEEPLFTLHGSGPDTRALLLRRALAPSVGAFYPAAALAEAVRRRVDSLRCDLVFHVWSPEALAACSAVDSVPVFAYQGNPDHLPATARLRHPRLFDVPVETAKERLLLRIRRLGVANWRRVHLRLVRRCHWTANNSALDARFYAERGHPRSLYVQNMWADLYEHAWESKREAAEPRAEHTIVGSIGNVGSTGNTFGLRFLGHEIVPALERLLGDRFTVGVYGTGRPYSQVAAALDHPRIRLHGWVDDIDGEIFSSEVFLLANNNCPDFRVGHTRLLHAWTLGACVVAHADIALAMPEVVHGENALLGTSGEEIAEHVAAVLRDHDLRRRLGDAGRSTFERSFTPRFVIGRVLEQIAA